MTVLTIYFCGTGSNKFDDSNLNFWNGELISTLASHNLGREFAEWIIIDGPGSGNIQDDELWVESGKYLSYTGIIENDNGERYVSKGSIGTRFSLIKGDVYTPASGLTSDYLVNTSIYDILK